VALKACDKMGAFIEASLSISHGIKSKELINGKEQILRSIEKNPIINGVNFYEWALKIDSYLSDPPQGSRGT